MTARLLERAHRAGDEFQSILVQYCFERFLYRLGTSDVFDRFILKGATLMRIWSDRPYGPTRDLDLLRHGDGAQDAIRADISAICATCVPEDGIEFAHDALQLDSIQGEGTYAGVRVILPAGCGQARLRLQIDIGVGDVVWPPASACDFPALLEFSAPRVLAYPPEAVVAEKPEAIVQLGERNTRLKDFFDIEHMTNRFNFDRERLVEAVGRTFARRNTGIPSDDPIGLTPAYWQDETRAAQIAAFVRRARLQAVASPTDRLLASLRAFLLPVFADMRQGTSVTGHWDAGGPWR